PRIRLHYLRPRGIPSMPNMTEERAAALAVSRYGADTAKVRQVVRAVLQLRRDRKAADLLDSLLLEKILSAAQVQELRLDLERTQLAMPNPKSEIRNSKTDKEAYATGSNLGFRISDLETQAVIGTLPITPTSYDHLMR